MILLVIGGSGSGKSAYAENALLKLADEGECEKYYIATMRVSDDEARRKADRHRELRRGKGFTTIEKEADIHKAFEGIDIIRENACIGFSRGFENASVRVTGKKTIKARAALLECATNLAANEMFSDNKVKSEVQTADKVIGDIKSLNEGLTYLVIVSGNVFEDGVSFTGDSCGGDSYDVAFCEGASYDDATIRYMRALGMINRELAEIADEVVEVVAGIPAVIKRREKCI